MKTYPHATSSGIIELVEKAQYDADVSQYSAELEHNAMQALMWQSIAENLATALDNLSHDCHNHAKDIQKIRWGYDGDCGAKLSAEQIEECCDAANPALAAYESAKSGTFTDPLAEAVKRMEEVSHDKLLTVFENAEANEGWDGGIEAVRARLSSAAKGEQP